MGGDWSPIEIEFYEMFCPSGSGSGTGFVTAQDMVEVRRTSFDQRKSWLLGMDPPTVQRYLDVTLFDFSDKDEVFHFDNYL